MLRSASLLLIGGLTTQFGAAFAVTLFDQVGPSGTVFLRLALAALVLLALWRPVVRGHDGRDLRLVLWLGLTLGVMNWGFYHAIDHIAIGPAVTIEFLGPMGVALWGSRRAVDVVWVLLAAVAVVVLADPLGGGAGLDAAGVGFAVLAGAAWAAYIPLSARVGRGWEQASGLAVAMVVGALVVAPTGLAAGGSDLLHPALLGAGLLVALGSSVVPYSLEMFALRRLPEHVFGVLMSLEPAIACLAGWLVLGQGLSGTDGLAVALVVVASAGATAGAHRLQPVAA